MNEGTLAGLIVGLFVGGVIGSLVMAVLAAGKASPSRKVVAESPMRVDLPVDLGETPQRRELPVEAEGIDQDMREVMRRYARPPES